MNKVRVKKSRETYAGKRCIKQRVWDFMRRNKTFKATDLISLLEIKETTLRSILYAFEVAGYCHKKKDETRGRKNFLNTTFIFLAKDNILIAPIISNKKVKEELC